MAERTGVGEGPTSVACVLYSKTHLSNSNLGAPTQGRIFGSIIHIITITPSYLYLLFVEAAGLFGLLLVLRTREIEATKYQYHGAMNRT